MIKDPKSDNALEFTYKEKQDLNNKSAMNGIHCLHTNNKQLDEATLWKTYTTLTDLEAVFHSLKSELGEKRKELMDALHLKYSAREATRVYM